MGHTLEIYSTLSHKEALDLELLHEELVDRLADEDHGQDLALGELSATGMPADRVERLLAEYHDYRMRIPRPVLERLKRCRSIFSIDRPADFGDGDTLQDASIYFLLERGGECLLDWKGKGLEPSEKVLRTLSRSPVARKLSRMGVGMEAGRALQTRKARPGELRAIKLVEAIQRLSEDDELRVDLRFLFGRLSPDALAFARHLIESGATGNAESMRACKLAPERFEAAARELEAGLAELTD
jgi:hypothetical protein